MTRDDSGVVMPTANYMDRDYTATIGTEALNVYLELNQGRRVVLEKISLGSIRLTRKNFHDLWAKGWWMKHHRVAA